MKIKANNCAPEVTFEAPAGTYGGVLHNVYDTESTDRSGSQSMIRFIFRIEVPSMPDKTVLVAKNLPHNSPRLRAFLLRWLGEEFLEQYNTDGVELEDLIGTPADVEIQHFKNPGYKTPFRFLTGVYSRGSMKLTNNGGE